MRALSNIASLVLFTGFARSGLACLACLACSGEVAVAPASHDGDAMPPADAGNSVTAEAATAIGSADAAALDVTTLSDANASIAHAWVVASGQKDPAFIATDNVNVYWRNRGVGASAGPKTPLPYTGGAIMACPVGGCGGAAPETIVDSITLDPAGPFGFAADGTNVYFNADPADGGSALFACPASGCSSAPQVFFEGSTRGIATADGGVFWLAPDFSPSCYALACPASGCSSAPTCVWAPLDGGAENLQSNFVVDGDFAYWMDLYGTVSQCALPSCGSQSTTLFQRITAPTALAAAAGFVYVADGNPLGYGAIYQCPATGCPQGARMLASGLSSVTAIAADASYVYWTELGDNESGGTAVEDAGVVRRCAVTGCNGVPETFAANVTYPVAIAVGTSAVFWVEGDLDAGRIWAAAK